MRYYNTYKQQMQGKNITQATLKRMATQANLTHTYITPQTLHQKITHTKEEFQKIKKKHKDYREKFLQELAEEYSEEGTIPAQRAIQNIIERENTKKSTVTSDTP